MADIVVVTSSLNIEDESDIIFRYKVLKNCSKFQDSYIHSEFPIILASNMKEYRTTPVAFPDFNSYCFEVCADLSVYISIEEAINNCKQHLIKVTIEALETLKKSVLPRYDLKIKSLEEFRDMNSF